MIGIDKTDNDTLNIVRQFSCQECYRAWWKRVRIRKQVSTCSRCKKKYDALPFSKEFGIAEFRCQQCSHEFYHWSAKEDLSTCKICNNTVKPVKILPQTQNTRKFNMKSDYFSKKNGSQCSSSSNSSSSGNLNGIGICPNKIEENNYNSNNKNTNIGTSQIKSSKLNDNNSQSYRFRTYSNYSNRNRNYYCEHCKDTRINLRENIVFRPQKDSVHNYIWQSQTITPGTSFCTNCRRIPSFSEKHISTGSTLGSLSYQGDLEMRFLDEEIDLMEPCTEYENEKEDEEEENDPNQQIQQNNNKLNEE